MELEGAFCHGTTCREQEMVEAHADKLVRKIAGAITYADDLEAMLFYAVTATLMAHGPSTLGRQRRRMTAGDRVRADAVDDGAALWHASLSQVRLGYRRGAMVERVAANLVERRMPKPNVHTERRVVLSSGQATLHFDVLAAPADTTWEGIECKLPDYIEPWQAKELSFAASRASALGDPLIVTVASASHSTTLRAYLTAVLTCPELVFFVAAEQFSTLGKPSPRYPVAA
jgi:hypothetical protein